MNAPTAARPIRLPSPVASRRLVLVALAGALLPRPAAAHHARCRFCVKLQQSSM